MIRVIKNIQHIYPGASDSSFITVVVTLATVLRMSRRIYITWVILVLIRCSFSIDCLFNSIMAIWNFKHLHLSSIWSVHFLYLHNLLTIVAMLCLRALLSTLVKIRYFNVQESLVDRRWRFNPNLFSFHSIRSWLIWIFTVFSMPSW